MTSGEEPGVLLCCIQFSLTRVLFSSCLRVFVFSSLLPCVACCEDPTMPAERAMQLLKEWKEEQPHLSYSNVKQANACLALAGNESLAVPVRDQQLTVLRGLN